MIREHTDQNFESELAGLRQSLLLMGAKVEAIVSSGMKAFETQDADLARRTIESDHEINRLEVEIDGMVLSILARRQPVAADLRFLTTALKLVVDLERIGDLAVNLSERVIELSMAPELPPHPHIVRMAEIVQAMVRDALDAFVAGDAAKAQWVIERDRGVDALYSQAFREELLDMMSNPGNLQRGIAVQSVAKYLERVGDHATNLAEQVVFLAKGTDIRHTGQAHPAPPEVGEN